MYAYIHDRVVVYELDGIKIVCKYDYYLNSKQKTISYISLLYRTNVGDIGDYYFLY